jgi:hypothetical protein
MLPNLSIDFGKVGMLKRVVVASLLLFFGPFFVLFLGHIVYLGTRIVTDLKRGSARC